MQLPEEQVEHEAIYMVEEVEVDVLLVEVVEELRHEGMVEQVELQQVHEERQ